MIAQPRLSVLAVALSVGWGSGEAFARAFKQRFGHTPTEWRRSYRKFDQQDRNSDQALSGGEREHELSSTTQRNSAMQVNLIERPPVRVAYRRHIGPYDATYEPDSGRFSCQIMIAVAPL